MNHLGEANKMVETPRMKAAQMAAMEHGTGDVWRVGCDIERELNAASVEIERLTNKVAQLYEGGEEQKQRIKRLEEAGDEIEMILLQYASRAELPRTMAIEQSDLSKRLCVNWRKAKEANL